MDIFISIADQTGHFEAKKKTKIPFAGNSSRDIATVPHEHFALIKDMFPIVIQLIIITVICRKIYELNYHVKHRPSAVQPQFIKGQLLIIFVYLNCLFLIDSLHSHFSTYSLTTNCLYCRRFFFYKTVFCVNPLYQFRYHCSTSTFLFLFFFVHNDLFCIKIT